MTNISTVTAAMLVTKRRPAPRHLLSSSGMSGSSASAPRRRGVDIIDLDRYMRSAVKPPRDYREHFVVDAGGVDRAPRYSSGASDSSALSSAPPTPAHHTAHNKRFSHDSGLSDGSYVRRRQKTHRRKPDVSKQHEQQIPPYSSPSVREFRVACEKALRDQQEQIARVAMLCERLAQPGAAQRAEPIHQANEKPRPESKMGQRMPRAQGVGDSSDTSEISSSSSSQFRRKDKKRSESCKTYKIIMSKLDELNRLFAARRATSPKSSPSPSPAPPRRAASSRSVSMCDKLVATETLNQSVNRVITPTVQTVLTPRDYHRSEYVASAATRSVSRGQRSISSRERARSQFPHTYDLENPVHFYEQAKRLRSCRAGSRRARSAGGRSQPDTSYEEQFEPFPNVQHAQYAEHAEYVQCAGYASHVSHASHASHAKRESVLCAACRGYWRALWRHLLTLLRSKLF